MWRWAPTPSSAEVKERVDLYLCSPSGPSWPVPGWTLLYFTLLYFILPELYYWRSTSYHSFLKTLYCMYRAWHKIQLHWQLRYASVRYTSDHSKTQRNVRVVWCYNPGSVETCRKGNCVSNVFGSQCMKEVGRFCNSTVSMLICWSGSGSHCMSVSMFIWVKHVIVGQWAAFPNVHYTEVLLK